jgi:hypothetical protein
MTVTVSGSSSLGAVLNPVKPSIATTSTRWRQDSSRSANQTVKACLERGSTMPSSRAGPVASRVPVEPSDVVDEDTLVLGQDSVVGGVSGDPEPFGDTGGGEVLADDRFTRPPQPGGARASPRGSAALVVSCRPMCPQSMQRCSGSVGS